MRADIGMRLLIEAEDYAMIGAIMDAINGAVVQTVDRPDVKYAFDFTHFNTRPCKGSEMERRWEREQHGQGETVPPYDSDRDQFVR